MGFKLDLPLKLCRITLVSDLLVTDNQNCESNEPRHDKMCLQEFPTRSDSNWPAQLES